jgi:ElaB/YqjD/DUF883 family membrane-anchored ribosome-binding protein
LKAVTETVSEFGKETKESIEEFGRSAGRKMDEARDETGGALHAVASCVRTTGRQSAKAIDHCATRTADQLDATAAYVEDHDLRGMLQKFGRRHMTGSLVAAAAIGFIAGSALGRVTHSCGRAREAT